ncbi:YkgJ family cysteine cluster protein [Paraburkholderia phosphatilytica]|uniref:YkgJ family cysteine cluster protein n=1 Tax=Paraburkholderia phosphatilytica TaxID=2282883 RepID=UPI001F0C7023|nr:YkgJ family cysteine cluster protein [Paraburkholderia phosphatilytica]
MDDTDIDFHCTMCGKCCHNLRLPLTVGEAIAWLERGDDVDVLCEALPWPVEPDASNAEAIYRRQRSSPTTSGSLPTRIQIVLAASFAGPCPNLGEGNVCGIYDDRPLVCRIYPAEMNPFVRLAPEHKACPPDAWQGAPLTRGGRIVDAAMVELIERSQLASRQEIETKMKVCVALGLHEAALANEGFVIHAPERSVLLDALKHSTQSTGAMSSANGDWTYVSNRMKTVNALKSVGATSVFADTFDTEAHQYLGFFEAAAEA